MWSIASPMPVAASTSTEPSATFEKRGTTHRQRRRRARAAGRLSQSTSRPTSPPSQTEPAARCSQSNSSVSPRGEVCAACPAAPGHDQHRGRGRAARRSVAASSAIERCSRSGRSSHSAIQAGEAEQREAELEVDDRAPERGHAETAARARRGRTPSAASRWRSRSRGTRGSRSARAPTRPRTRPTRRAGSTPSTRLISGRAISIRSTNSPIATITDRNISPARDQQLRRGRGRRDVRHLELRRRPRVRADGVGERALHRVAVDRDRAPVDQVPALGQVRPQRHDQRVRVGRRAADRARSSPAGPAALVTEMIANRGSTASS